MTESNDKPKEHLKPQEAPASPDAARHAGIIGNDKKQADWKTTQKAHMLEQDESATDLFYRPGTARNAAQKFELVDSQTQEHHAVLHGRVEKNEHIEKPKGSEHFAKLSNTPKGWLAAGQKIAALPLDKQAQIIFSGLSAGIEQYQHG